MHRSAAAAHSSFLGILPPVCCWTQPRKDGQRRAPLKLARGPAVRWPPDGSVSLQSSRSASRPCYDRAPVSVDLSIVIPLYNEEESIRELYGELSAVLEKLRVSHEVVMVDDGSTDSTFRALEEIARADPRVTVIRFRRNFGQTAALSAGIEHARGSVIVPMDGDLQNDPADIPNLLAKMAEGYDCVSGWRADRKDKAITRRLPSAVANRLVSWISGVRLHDYGCTLKAYRREVIEGVRLYGEMHRFIPIFTAWQGARVSELKVNHRPRRYGASKYGLSRVGKVLLDLAVVKFLFHYMTKPIYVFGGFGLFAFTLAVLSFCLAAYYKLAGLKDFVETPLPLATVMFVLVGCLSMLMGLLAEVMVRTYYESQSKRPYLAATVIEAGREKPAPAKLARE
ncbi:MAG: glycosyltransferase family 2 protein [Myxococcales bacterium]|nr:glycosyltransferase family 2 protein [Myxococcales bacterium]